jgi:ribosomal protein L21E
MVIPNIVLLLGIFIFSITSCTENQKNTTQISLITKNDTLHFVQIKTDSTTDKWELPYPVYQFKTGDINQDGKEDIMVGVIKTTHFDSTMSKRLFIFKNYKGYVRPLWLGSRLGQPLIDFNFVIVNKEARIRSLELEQSGKYLVAEYKWRRFGLEFIHYLEREINYKKALHLLQN